MIKSAYPLRIPPCLKYTSELDNTYTSENNNSSTKPLVKPSHNLTSRIHHIKYKRCELAATILLNQKFILQECPFTFNRDEISAQHN